MGIRSIGQTEEVGVGEVKQFNDCHSRENPKDLGDGNPCGPLLSQG